MTAKLVSYNPSNSEAESWKGGVQFRHFSALKPSLDAGSEDSNIKNKILSPGPSTVNAYNSIFDIKKKIRFINWNSEFSFRSLDYGPFHIEHREKGLHNYL